MRKLLVLTVSLFLVTNAAMADHIGIYAEEAGYTCDINTGFSTTAAIVHKFSAGATGARFKMDLSQTPGTVYFTFVTPYTPSGALTSDLSIGYGTCVSGSFAIGTILATWAPGIVSMVPAQGFASIITADCAFQEHNATGGQATIGGGNPVCPHAAVEAATWGKVKSLYR
jgi:hypothetical protein